MKFCKKCDNMLYLQIDENDMEQLMHFCRKCGFKDKIIKKNATQEKGNTEDYCIYKEHVEQNTKFENFVNQYTKYDPTLPVMKNINCPNPNCSGHKSLDSADDVVDSNSDSYSDIIYLRYDDENMKYLYMCKKCDNTWTA